MFRSRRLPAGLLALALLWAAIQIPRFGVPAYVGASSLLGDFGLTAATAGLLIAVYFPVYAAMQIPGGLLADRYPPARILRVGSLALVATTLAFALAPNFAVAVLVKALAGLVDGVIWQAMLKRSSETAPHAYDRAVGSLVAAQGLGQVAALLGLPLLLAFFSWRSVTILTGLPVILAVAAVWLSSQRGVTRPAARREHPLAGLWDSLSHPRFWPVALPAALWNGGQFGILAWLPRYARDVLGQSTAATGLMAATMSVGVLVGGILTGAAARPERRRTLFYGGALATVTLQLVFALTVGGMSEGLYPLVFLMGVLFATYFLSLSLVGGLVSPARLGAATGALNTINFIPAFIAPWVMGLVLDTVDRPGTADPVFSAVAYRAAFLFPGLTLVAALALAALLLWRTGPQRGPGKPGPPPERRGQQPETGGGSRSE